MSLFQKPDKESKEHQPESYPPVEHLGKEELVVWILDAFRRSVVHYGTWYAEVAHKLGPDDANRLEAQAGDRGMGIMLERLGQVLGFEMRDGLPGPLLDMDREKLLKLTEAISKNWLVGDGVWFQAVEHDRRMQTAKLCNDGCWAAFSPYEAYRIKQLLGLGDNPGLEGLAAALQMRLYSRINMQSLHWQDDGSLVFEMNECRVQVARARKGMDDYPCKSAGLIEYPYFASAIDSRIRTECVGCPPDPHPKEWWCAWHFYIDE